MIFARTPLSFQESKDRVGIVRDIEERITMLDNLVELIVFTPRGSFNGDPDFGFEYWNHEFSNIHFRLFNNDQMNYSDLTLANEVTKTECQESIRKSLASYAPSLKQVMVTMQLNLARATEQSEKKVPSKYFVVVNVTGIIDDGLGTNCKYEKSVKFLIEPTAKKFQI